MTKTPGKYALAFIFITVTLNMIGFGVIMPVMPQLIMDVTGEDLSNAAQWAATCRSSTPNAVHHDADYRRPIGPVRTSTRTPALNGRLRVRLPNHGRGPRHRRHRHCARACRGLRRDVLHRERVRRGYFTAREARRELWSDGSGFRPWVHHRTRHWRSVGAINSVPAHRSTSSPPLARVNFLFGLFVLPETLSAETDGASTGNVPTRSAVFGSWANTQSCCR